MPRTREQDREYRKAYRARKRAETAAAKKQPAAKPASDTRERSPKPGPHRAAVTRMLRATGLVHVPEEAPLVELVKTLAAELDAGAEGAAASRYRAALADVRRVLAYSGRPQSSSDTPPPAEEPPASSPVQDGAPVNSLAAFKAARGM